MTWQSPRSICPSFPPSSSAGSCYHGTPSRMCRTLFFFFSSRRRHTRCSRDWSSDVCSSDLHDPRRSVRPRRAAPDRGPTHRPRERLLRPPARRPRPLPSRGPATRRRALRRDQLGRRGGAPEGPGAAAHARRGARRARVVASRRRPRRRLRRRHGRPAHRFAQAPRPRQGDRLHRRVGARGRSRARGGGKGGGRRRRERSLHAGPDLTDRRALPVNIALVKLSSLGDVVHALPVAAALRGRLPRARLALVVERREAALLTGNGVLDAVIPVDTRGWRRALTPLDLATAGGALSELARELRAARFDVALDLQGLLKSGLLTAATRAPLRIGFAARLCRERLSALFTNRP